MHGQDEAIQKRGVLGAHFLPRVFIGAQVRDRRRAVVLVDVRDDGIEIDEGLLCADGRAAQSHDGSLRGDAQLIALAFLEFDSLLAVQQLVQDSLGALRLRGAQPAARRVCRLTVMALLFRRAAHDVSGDAAPAVGGRVAMSPAQVIVARRRADVAALHALATRASLAQPRAALGAHVRVEVQQAAAAARAAMVLRHEHVRVLLAPLPDKGSVQLVALHKMLVFYTSALGVCILYHAIQSNRTRHRTS